MWASLFSFGAGGCSANASQAGRKYCFNSSRKSPENQWEYIRKEQFKMNLFPPVRRAEWDGVFSISVHRVVSHAPDHRGASVIQEAKGRFTFNRESGLFCPEMCLTVRHIFYEYWFSVKQYSIPILNDYGKYVKIVKKDLIVGLAIICFLLNCY